MWRIIPLYLFTASVLAASFNVPITINGATCSQSSATSFNCGSSPTPPQCPSPPGAGPCPPTPPTPGSCNGFTNTIHMTASWANPTRLYTSNFGPNDALVVQFTTGGISSPNNNLPKIGGAEYNSTPSGRIATLSATACDWSAQAWPGASVVGNTVTVPFAVGSGSNYGYYAIIPFNTTYYLNIKNAASPGCGASGNCNMYIDLLKPGGM